MYTSSKQNPYRPFISHSEFNAHIHTATKSKENDRFLPHKKHSNFAVQECINDTPLLAQDKEQYNVYDCLIKANQCYQAIVDPKVLAYTPKKHSNKEFIERLRNIYSIAEKNAQKIVTKPYQCVKNLDAPCLIKDPNYTVIDWNGSKLAVCLDSNLYLWSYEKSNIEASLQFDTMLTSVCFTKDESKIFYANHEGEVTFYDVNKSHDVTTFYGSLNPVNTLSYNNTNGLLAVGSKEMYVPAFDMRKNGEAVQFTGFPNDDTSIIEVKWSPDGSKLAAGGKEAKVWNKNYPSKLSNSGRMRHCRGGAIRSIAWSPLKYNTLATSSLANPKIKIWSTEGTALSELLSNDNIVTVMWDTDTYDLISSHASKKSQFNIWDFERKISIGSIGGDNKGLIHSRMEAGMIASVSNDEVIRMWRKESLACKEQSKKSDSWMHSLR